jgi:DNA modification methylase
MGAIIWQKKTTMNTTGGASVMGSYPYPRNGLIEIDYEFILMFKKLGKTLSNISAEIKEASKLTNEEWRKYFTGHWNFAGVKQNEHVAMFPDELPRRIIKMFSFKSETVLDPFVGSGTTLKVAMALNRNSVGYEINKEFLPIIKTKIGLDIENLLNNKEKVDIIIRKEKINPIIKKGYVTVINRIYNRINHPDYWKTLKLNKD